MSDKAQTNKRRNILATIAVILFLTGVAKGDLPVIDVTHIRESRLGFVRTVVQLVAELKQLEFMQQYAEVIDGHWKEAMRIADVVQTEAASLGIPIEKIGWGRIDNFRKDKATQAVGEALNEINQIMSAQADRKKMGDVREHIEQIYGDVPVTRAGAPVEAAYRAVAQNAVFSGESNKALLEELKNAARLQDMIERGNLPPGDLERIQTYLADLRYRAQIHQTQAILQTNNLLQQSVGMKAAEEGRIERNRLKDNQERFQFMGSVLFSPAVHENDAGDE